MSKYSVVLSREEQNLYDRQIRIWGFEFQKKVGNSNVLVIGCGLVGQEVCKNLLLGGVKNLVLYDNDVYTSEDSTEILISTNDIGIMRSDAVKKNAKKLNPFAKIECCYSIYDKKQGDVLEDNTFLNTDIVIFTDEFTPEAKYIENICLKLNKPLIFGFGHKSFGGMYNNSWSKKPFILLGDERIVENYSGLFCGDISFLRSSILKKYSDSELNLSLKFCEKNSKNSIKSNCSGPIAAVLGATICQEVFKMVGNDKEVFDNYLHYDIDENLAVILHL